MLQSNIQHQEDLNEVLQLRFPAVALKMVEKKDENKLVPADALKPMEKSGKHIALCQAFAYARRQGKTVYMRKEDHWCWNPLMTYGHVECVKGTEPFNIISRVIGISDPEKAEEFVNAFPKFPYGKYEGTLVAPLDKADFDPDITLIYLKNDQLRCLLMAVSSQTGSMIDSAFTALDSCTYSVINPMHDGNYRITLPDPGEYERALTPEDDIIFSVPAQKEEEFYKGLAFVMNKGHGYRKNFFPAMKQDFERPRFYNQLYKAWGLDQGEDWDKS